MRMKPDDLDMILRKMQDQGMIQEVETGRMWKRKPVLVWKPC
jgi:hypothetical protein